MCGLVGLVGDIDHFAVDTFYNMLLLDTVRGTDSTGACIVNRKKGVATAKELGHPLNLINSKRYRKLVADPMWNITALLGHNRHATAGAKIKRNAHPFTHGHITLMHNGTLKSHIQAGQKKRFDTDSESVAYAMSVMTPAEVWSKLDGAACLVWYDDKDKSYNFIRNEQRPLMLALDKSGRTLMYGSEEWIIDIGARKGRMQVGDKENLAVNRHVKAKYDWLKNKITLEAEELVPFERPPLSRVHHLSGQTSGGTGTSTGTTQCNDNLSIGFEFDPWEGMDEHTFQQWYDKCVFCDESLEHEYKRCTIIDEDNAACESCSSVAHLENLDMSAMLAGAK